jgi:hypothetical protein
LPPLPLLPLSQSLSKGLHGLPAIVKEKELEKLTVHDKTFWLHTKQ